MGKVKVEIPTISIGKVTRDPKRPAKPAKSTGRSKSTKPGVDKKVKAARKASGRVEKRDRRGKGTGSKVKKARKRAQAELSNVPVEMAPPTITDSRPVHVPEPEPAVNPLPSPAATDETGPAAATADAPVKPKTVSTRLVQGAQCTWLGPVDDAPDSPITGHPCCPYCKGGLLESPDRMLVEAGFLNFELGTYTSINPPPRPHPGYTQFMMWLQKQTRCWDNLEMAASDYHIETGRVVDPGM